MNDLTKEVNSNYRTQEHSKVLEVWEMHASTLAHESQQSYKHSVKKLCLWLTSVNKPVCDATFLQIDENQVWRFRKWLEAQPGTPSREERLLNRKNQRALEKKGSYRKPRLSPSSVQGYLNGMRSLYSQLVKEKLISENPFKSERATIRLKDSDKRLGHQAMTKEQVGAMLKAFKGTSIINLRRRAVIAFLFYTGCRQGEVTNLKCCDVFIEAKIPYVRFRQTKNGRDRNIPINPNLMPYLEAYWKRRGVSMTEPYDYFFLSKSFRKLQKTAINRDFKKALAVAGMEPEMWSPHCTRHTAICLAAEAGASESELLAMSGHVSADTLRKVYLKPVIQLQNNAAMQLPY